MFDIRILVGGKVARMQSWRVDVHLSSIRGIGLHGVFHRVLAVCHRRSIEYER